MVSSNMSKNSTDCREKANKAILQLLQLLHNSPIFDFTELQSVKQ